jgi:serine/threonine protein kinase/Tol biopolymer transport system component
MGAEPPLNPDLPTDDARAAELSELESRLGIAAGAGRYRVVSRVGAGGMGIVYKAIDTRLNRAVAIKAVLESRASPDASGRLRKEARAAASLDHPYICRVYELVQTDREQLIVMEFIEGETLAARLARGPLPVSTTLQLGLEIAEGLANAHQQGLVHRDLKPANIMVTPHGHIKLLDFGLARVDPSNAPTGDSQSTGSGRDAFAGTPHYMAPEQAGGRPVSPLTDLFSLGVVLYECISGRLPFQGANHIEYLTRLRSEAATPLQRVASATPDDVARVIDACLGNAPATRPQSAAAVVAELRRLATGSSTSNALNAPGARRAPVFWAAAAVLGVAAVAAAGWVVWQSRSPAASIWRSRPLMTASRGDKDSRISPDKQWLSYVSSTNGETRLFVKRVDGGDAQRVELAAGTILDHAWSLDGSQLLVALRQEQSLVLQIVAAFFGRPVVRAIPLELRANQLQVRQVTSRAVFVEAYDGIERTLHRLDLDTGKAVALSATWTITGSPFAFAVNADGRQVAIAASLDGQQDLWVTDVEGRAMRRLTNDAAFERFPLWAGASIVYQSNRGGQIDLWEIDSVSGEARQMTSSRDIELPASASADGRLVTFTQTSDESHLWKWDRGSAPAQLTHDALTDSSPVVSADQSLVVFERSNPTPLGIATDSTILAATLTGATISAPRTIGDGFNAMLSPDGTLLAYQSGPQPRTTLSVLRLSTNERFTVSNASPRPAYLPFPADWAEQNFAWSATGEELYFIDGADRATIRRYRVGTSEAPAVMATVPSTERLRDLQPSSDGRSLAYLSAAPPGGGGTSTVLAIDVATGSRRPIAGIEGPGRVHLRGWLPGGSELVLMRARRYHDDLTADVDVIGVSAAGRQRVLGMVTHAWVATVRIDQSSGTLYVTRVENGVPNVYSFAPANAALVRVTDNTRAGIAFSGVVPLPRGAFLAIRSEHKSDVWMMERELGVRNRAR